MVVFGGSDGVLQCFSFKKGELHLTFKTLPSEPISTLELGGPVGGIYDRIFVSSRNEVRGFTKKGKIFLGFDTNLTEPIRSMYVIGNDLLVAGIHVFNHYKDCKDVNSYLSSDTINHITTLSFEKTHKLTPVLACEDRVLRVLDRSSLVHTLPLPSPPVTTSLLHDSGGPSGDCVVYALANGEIGMVQIARSGIYWKWILENSKRREAVRCMCWYDITKDGIPELIVGRDDGSIQVYGEPLERMSDSDPLVENYNYVCNESILSVQAGNVGSPSFDEIVATTYTGWLFGLTTELLEKQVSLNTNSSGVSLKLSSEDKLKIDKLRSEIEDIEKSVAKERERYQLSTQEDSIGISTIPHISISEKLTLVKESSVLQLTVEAETPIDNVMLQSDVQTKLLDVEKNSAVVSHSTCDPKSGNQLLATYRCQVNTTKLSMVFQCPNESGTLNMYITPHAQPKAAHLRSYVVRRLGMYSRVHDFDEKRFDLRSARLIQPVCLFELIISGTKLTYDTHPEGPFRTRFDDQELVKRNRNCGPFWPRVGSNQPFVENTRLRPDNGSDSIAFFMQNRPYNALILKGTFSIGEMHNWIGQCLPEIPDKIPTSNSTVYKYESSLTGAQLQCRYTRGEAEFMSDDISAIATLKDFLTKEATMKKINLDISFQTVDDSIHKILSLIYPKLKTGMTYQRQSTLLEALNDIETTDNDSATLFIPECARILNKKYEIQDYMSKQANQIDAIKEIVLNLFSDWYRFKNCNGRAKYARLAECLSQSLTFEDLLDLFDTSHSNLGEP